MPGGELQRPQTVSAADPAMSALTESYLPLHSALHLRTPTMHALRNSACVYQHQHEINYGHLCRFERACL